MEHARCSIVGWEPCAHYPRREDRIEHCEWETTFARAALVALSTTLRALPLLSKSQLYKADVHCVCLSTHAARTLVSSFLCLRCCTMRACARNVHCFPLCKLIISASSQPSICSVCFDLPPERIGVCISPRAWVETFPILPSVVAYCLCGARFQAECAHAFRFYRLMYHETSASH